jgi:hypothetical protein
MKDFLDTYFLLLMICSLILFAHMRGRKDKAEYCAIPLSTVEVIFPAKALACWLGEGEK